MNDIWMNRLSEYLDGELDSTERAALDAHLATCGVCFATLGELKRVVARAQALEDSQPDKDLWPRIRARLTPEHGSAGVGEARHAATTARRRFTFSVPQLLAASVALVLMSGGAVGIAMHQKPSNTPVPAAARLHERGMVAAASWTGTTDAAIADLQATLTQNESRLDTTTVRIVRQNLAIIDRAIAEARTALQKDPGNAYLNLHLADTMRRKVELLRRVNDIAAQS